MKKDDILELLDTLEEQGAIEIYNYNEDTLKLVEILKDLGIINIPTIYEDVIIAVLNSQIMLQILKKLLELL
jgi:hypothetical protein